MVPPPPDQNNQPFTDLSIPDVRVSQYHTLYQHELTPLQASAFNFDFDTFLNTDADATGFGFDPSISYSADGVETGAGDGI
jgi:hypothetical protein